MYQVTFLPSGLTVAVEEGATLLEAQIKAGLRPDAPCGGAGTCGKCLVELVVGDDDTDIVKACRTYVDRDMTVILPEKTGNHRILTSGVGGAISVDSAVKKMTITVKKATLTELSSDWTRVSEAVADAFNVPAKSVHADLALVSRAGKILRNANYTVEAVVCGDEVLDLRWPERRIYTAAVDIGTTTVVLYLLDAVTGETVAVKSMLNPQTEYGADVIMRANYAIENSVEPLADSVRGAVRALISEAAEEAGVDPEDIYSVTAVGNTCMHHLFLGIEPESLVLAPYNPVISQELVLNAADHDISINPMGKLYMLPCIAGFVGADTSAVMLACEFDKLDDLTLAIDIGTNGELVLGNKDGCVTCSTAAGPAFEGAKITCGMRGVDGAVDHVKLTDKGISYSVIGGGKPAGICGSGLLDLVAALLEAGVVDETGRIVDEDELDTELSELVYRNITDMYGLKAYVIAGASESATGGPVYLSQKDIREVQLAKGAMAAGIRLMLKDLGRKTADVRRVFIAGAFGNYMDPASACRIGLIPQELRDRIKAVGNAAGEGAKMAAVNINEFYRVSNMVENTRFTELASDPEFQDCFVEELMFPEED